MNVEMVREKRVFYMWLNLGKHYQLIEILLSEFFWDLLKLVQDKFTETGH